MSTEWAQPQNLRKKHVIHNLNCPLYRVQFNDNRSKMCVSHVKKTPAHVLNISHHDLAENTYAI